MGKSNDTPATPDYKGEAIATANSGKYNEITPYGQVLWSLRPGADPNNPRPGDSIRTTDLSPEQKQLYQQGVGNQLALGTVGQNQIQDLTAGGDSRQALQDALYRRSTQYYDQNFGDQQAALRGQLLNSGLQEGTEAYDKAMRNFGQQRNTAYADAADRAVVGAEGQSQTNQNNAISRLAQIMAMSRGQNPTSGNSAGGAATDFSGAANNAYSANLSAANANNAASAQQASTLGSLGMTAAMMFL